jgi:hypothetical protein
MTEIKPLTSQTDREAVARRILFHPLVTEDDWREVAKMIDDDAADEARFTDEKEGESFIPIVH